MTCSEIKKEARESLRGKWGTGVLIVLVYSIVEFVISFILGIIPETNKVLSIIGLIIQFIISVPLTFGLIFTFIKLKRSEKVSPFDFISLGFSNFGKSWGIALSMAVRLIIPIILVIIAAIIISSSIISQTASSLSGSSSSTPSFLIILGVILYIVAIVFFFIRSIALSLSFYLAYDKPELGGMETTKKSLELMKGHVGKAILLSLSFIGWALLLILPYIILYIYTYMNVATLSFISSPVSVLKSASVFSAIISIYMFVGELFLIPYMQTSLVCFYEKVAKNNTSSPIINETSNE